MGDNTELGTLAVTEELHAKQQEAARKEAVPVKVREWIAPALASPAPRRR